MFSLLRIRTCLALNTQNTNFRWFFLSHSFCLSETSVICSREITLVSRVKRSFIELLFSNNLMYIIFYKLVVVADVSVT